jgi:hypothetical protein
LVQFFKLLPRKSLTIFFSCVIFERMIILGEKGALMPMEPEEADE